MDCLIEIIEQRGPTTGLRNNFAQFKSCRSQPAATLYKKAWRADGTESGLRPILSENLFFFGERYEFGTKIGISSRLRPASSNNFEKWPTRVQKLDHPLIE